MYVLWRLQKAKEATMILEKLCPLSKPQFVGMGRAVIKKPTSQSWGESSMSRPWGLGIVPSALYTANSTAVVLVLTMGFVL